MYCLVAIYYRINALGKTGNVSIPLDRDILCVCLLCISYIKLDAIPLLVIKNCYEHIFLVFDKNR